MMNPMLADPIPREQITQFLNALGERAVVLRNHDVWANLERGGDIDLLVPDVQEAARLLVATLGPPRWATHRSYVHSYFYPWGHLDLTDTIEWRGARFLETAQVLREAEPSAWGFRRPRPAHEALMSWFYSLIWGGFFKQRYAEGIRTAARDDAEAFQAACRYAVGPVWGPRLVELAETGDLAASEAWVAPLRTALRRQALKRDPRGTLRRALAFWRAEMRLRWRPPLPWGCVLGPDGSGKSSVLEQLQERLAAQGLRLHLEHWRPRWLGGSSEGQAPTTEPHSQPPRSTAASVLKLGFLVLDWQLGYWLRLAHRRAKNTLVLFDRHYVDLLIDPVRYRYGAPVGLARWVRRLIPQPDFWILLDAPAEVLQARKQEVPFAETERQRIAYRELVADLPGAWILDASQPLDEVVQQAEEAILHALHAHARHLRNV